MTPFEKRCELIEAMGHLTRNDERYTELRNAHDITLPAIIWLNAGVIQGTDSRLEDNVNYLWDSWLGMVGVEDTGYTNIFDIDPDLDPSAPSRELTEMGAKVE